MEPTKQNDFLADYMAFHEGTEVPITFAVWCGIAAVSCCLGRRVFMQLGHMTVYPNLYVVLVAGSGKQRKSTAINIANHLVRSHDPPFNLIGQKMSAQSLIKSLRVIETEGGKYILRESAVGFGIVSELGNFISSLNYDEMGELLIPLYDCESYYEYRTLARGKEPLHKLCLGLLAGTTADYLRRSLPVEAVGDGLTSRILFVYTDKPSPPIAWPEYSDSKKSIGERLIRAVQRLGTISGEVHPTTDAKELFKKEYDRFYHESNFNELKNLRGYASRRGDHMLKIAMIFAAVESDAMVMEARHLKGAQLLLEQIEENLPLVLSLITSTQQGETILEVLATIRRHKKISRSDLLATFLHKMTTRDMSEILDTLTQSMRVVCEVNGSSVFYKSVR